MSMNIPPPKPRSSFNSLIEGGNVSKDTNTLCKESSDLKCNEFENNLIHNITKGNHLNENKILKECKNHENIFEEQENKMDILKQNMQNLNKGNINFDEIDLSEINNEIEKTKESIKANEQLFQQKIQDIQKMREASEKVTLLKRKAIALYNEMVLWSQNELKTKYPHVNTSNNLPHSTDVYRNSSKDPDSISEQILVYFKDIKKQIKGK